MAAAFSGRNRLVREQLFPNHSPLFPDIPTFPHTKYLWNTSAENGCYVQAIAIVTGAEVSMNRLVSIVDKRTVVRARDLYRSGIHLEALSRALQRGLLLKIGRGLYARKDFSADFVRQIMLACKRVPNGIVCLKSAGNFHGFLPLRPNGRRLLLFQDRSRLLVALA